MQLTNLLITSKLPPRRMARMPDALQTAAIKSNNVHRILPRSQVQIANGAHLSLDAVKPLLWPPFAHLCSFGRQLSRVRTDLLAISPPGLLMPTSLTGRVLNLLKSVLAPSILHQVATHHLQ